MNAASARRVITSAIILGLCVVRWTHSIEIEGRSRHRNDGRESRKLFGGYRITPRYCQPTRELSMELTGPSICMFHHECIQRNGLVVGACMDGFLFGACCQLPSGSAGELMNQEMPLATQRPNGQTKTPALGHITSSGLSHITHTLLYGNRPVPSNLLPTAADNSVIQINNDEQFASAGITHPTAPETDTLVELHAGDNDITPDDFHSPVPFADRKTTLAIEDTTQAADPDSVSPYIHISISNAPSYYTPAPIIGKPAFRPKPNPNEQYVLVPTIHHQTKNKTELVEQSVINIVQLLNDSKPHATGATTTQLPSSIYTYATKITTPSTSRKPASTTIKATSTATTTSPRRTTSKYKFTTKSRLGTTTKKGSTPVKKGTYYTTSTSKKPSNQYSSASTSKPTSTSTKKPPSTSYVYSSTISKRPVTSQVTVPGFAVTSPTSLAPPTIIVLGPTLASTSPNPTAPTKYTSLTPASYTTSTSTKHPVTVTINNHITQHIHNTSERPSPTVLITPKPIITTTPLLHYYDSVEDTIGQATDGDNLINFPPVRNPNLNMTVPIFNLENDISTPDFIEDAALNTKVESFVNKIIAGLQEPFEGLKEIVNNGINNKTDTTPTKKPVKKTSTKKPTTRPPTRVTTTQTQKITTSKVKTTKPTENKVTTIPPTESLIENDDISQDYRSQCGIRPLVKSGRIVGGKGATFGEFPWQVLVRESTWLGLFTKNKCGGVLISNKYVMTAAHCQPGFLASLVAVFGEFDISGDLEVKRAVSRNVKRVIVHRQYDAATFENDLALLELEQPIQFDAHIVPICLPRDHEDFTGRMATVTGWGRLKYGGGVPSVLQEVQVPIMENTVCQEMFRTAGHQKIILDSFLCAGYANGQKDSCEGDSGGPLVLQRPDGRYQLAGTVSHGIKCAAPYLPGVYMRTTYYKPWIESVTAVH